MQTEYIEDALKGVKIFLFNGYCYPLKKIKFNLTINKNEFKYTKNPLIKWHVLSIQIYTMTKY